MKIKLKVPATQHHRRKRPAPAQWRAISNVRFLFGLTTYSDQFSENFVTRVMSNQNRSLSKTHGHAMTAGDDGGRYIGPMLQ
jgi:hypothetical protein